MREVAPALIVHGGAGNLGVGESSGANDAPRLAGVRAACEAAWRVLSAGGSALDAVELAVRALEDDPSYNAGTGSCLNEAGEVELDAAIMDGGTLACGAVGAVRDVQNPVTLARRVMERTPHALLVAEGASALARAAGIPRCEGARLVTERQRARWEELRAQRARDAGAPPGLGEAANTGLAAGAGWLPPPGSRAGTVGAAARDVHGHLAAATSTGGMAMKMAGRVGDSPLIGAGTYADDRLAAVSCTGHGERIIQVSLARHAAELVGRGHAPGEAASLAVKYLGERVAGEGGLVLVAPFSEPAFAFNAQAMARAWVDAGGRIHAAV